MLKQTLKNYINKHNDYTLQTTPKYLNNHTGELTNTPIITTIYDILYFYQSIKDTLKYITSWVKFNP